MKFVVIIGIVVVGGIGIWMIAPGKEIVEQVIVSPEPTAVETVNFNTGGESLSTTAFGQVVSVTRVDVFPEIQGVISGLSRSLGSRVQSGQTVVTLESATQREQLRAAQASLESATAQYQQVVDEADESDVATLRSNLSSTESSLQSTIQNSLTTLDSLYTTLESTVKGSFDGEFFTNVHTDFPDITLDLDNNEELELEIGQERREIEETFEGGRGYSNVDSAIALFRERARLSLDLTDSVRVLVNQQEVRGNVSENTKEGWLSTLAQTEDAIETLLVQNTTLAASLNQARSSVESAQENLADLLAGANADEIAVAQAAVDSAQSAVDQARLALSKTAITAPVPGNIASMDLRVGQLVGPQTVLFTIANESTLRIDSKVSPDIARSLSVGDRVVVDDLYQGRISVISPSVDEVSGQVDIQVLLQEQSASLVSGTGVNLTISLDQPSSNLQLPISAVFVRDGTAYVYVVQDGVSVPQPIESGDLFGEYVIVTAGINSRDQVITNARQVKDGEQVTIE